MIDAAGRRGDEGRRAGRRCSSPKREADPRPAHGLLDVRRRPAAGRRAAQTCGSQVVNGSGVDGRGDERARATLAAHGFVGGRPGQDADRSDYPKTQVRYAPARCTPKAITVALVPRHRRTSSKPRPTATARAAATCVVIVGADWDDLVAPAKRAPDPTSSTSARHRGDRRHHDDHHDPAVAGRDRDVPVDPTTGGPLVGCP